MDSTEVSEEIRIANLKQKEMEVFLVLGIIVVLILWFRSYRALFQAHRFHLNKTHRTLFAGLPVFCVAFVAVVVSRHASPDVQSNPLWIGMYAIGAAVWLQLGLSVFSLLGVGARDDAVERQNAAAGWAVYGAMIGTMFCYAGSTVGKGPGVEVDLFCAVLSTGFLFGFWFLFERAFRLADRITIERDESAGIRTGGWILSMGMIFGEAVTGDWVSVGATLRDFYRHAWVGLLFLLGAMAVEAAFQRGRTPGSISRNVSVAVALVYFLSAGAYVAWRGVH